jgi:hypothetical protein
MEQVATKFDIHTMNEQIKAGDIFKGDIFKHYKGNLYKVICVSCDSEDLSWYVVYETLYDNKVSTIWHRPLDMFLGFLEVDGKLVKRFEKVV